RREGRRLRLIPQPVGDPEDALLVERRGRRARSEPRAQVPLVDTRVVPVPVELHALLPALIPDRREIGDTYLLAIRRLLHREAEKRFRRIEGVHASRTPS